MYWGASSPEDRGSTSFESSVRFYTSMRRHIWVPVIIIVSRVSVSALGYRVRLNAVLCAAAGQIQNSVAAQGRDLSFTPREPHVEACVWRRGWETKRVEVQVPANGLWNKVTDKRNRFWTQFKERRYLDGNFPSILHDSYSFRRNYVLLDRRKRGTRTGEGMISVLWPGNYTRCPKSKRQYSGGIT
jgi:hypothetical protein